MRAILARLPRWINRIYAKAFGYFWSTCPICGRAFGGHEIGRHSLIDPASTALLLLEDGANGWYWSPGHGQIGCYQCDEWVGKENAKRALAILGPERYREAFEKTRDFHHRQMIRDLGTPPMIVGAVDE